MSAQSSGHHHLSGLLNIGSSKCKKSKNDTLRAAIGVLLKQKNIVASERFRKSDFVLLQSRESFVLQKMLESDLHVCNAFLYSNVICLTNNSHLVDQQFGKLSQFIELENEEIRTELRRFYAPILCHLYVLLIKAGESKTAVEFMRKYAHCIAPVDTYDANFTGKTNGCSMLSDSNTNEDSSWQQLHIGFAAEAYAKDNPELEFFMQLIEKLSTCRNFEALEIDEDIMHFFSSKYELHTSRQVIQTLCQFLEKHGHVLILNIILNWIHVHILDNEVANLTEERTFMHLDNADDDDDDDDEDDGVFVNRTDGNGRQTVSSDATTENVLSKHFDSKTSVITSSITQAHVKSDGGITTADGDIKFNDLHHKIKHSMNILKNYRDILKSPVEIPRIIVVSDKSQGLTAGVLDGNECHLAAGFNSSLIQLWQMDQKFIEGRNIYERHSNTYCRWRASCMQSENNEEEEDDDGNNASEKVNQKYLPSHPNAEHTEYKRNYYRRKYEDNSYNCFGGISLRGHSLGVTGVKFSLQHSLLYSISKDSSMRCWRAENFACAGIYTGHHYPIWCMDESPTGVYMATGSKDQTARLWSLEREHPLITYIGHTQDVESLAFHPNGNYIATGSADASVRLWCVSSGKLMRIFSDCKQPVYTIAFSPDGKLLAVGGEETKLRIFDIAACSQLNELKDCPASAIAWSSNGQYLVSACHDSSLRIVDVKKLTSTTSESTTSTTSETTSNYVRSLTTKCKRLVNVFFASNNTITCIGC